MHRRRPSSKSTKRDPGPRSTGQESQKATAASRLSRDSFTLLLPPRSALGLRLLSSLLVPTPPAVHIQECSLHVLIAFACLWERSWFPSNGGGARRRLRSRRLPSAASILVVDQATRQLLLSHLIIFSSRAVAPQVLAVYCAQLGRLPFTCSGDHRKRRRVSTMCVHGHV
jgi:hypothetical protein